jgi:periplasmic divalent cation tolerance protein
VSSASGSSIIVVLTTLPAETDAVAFGRTLIEEKLAACVNVLPPMTSIYRWQGQIEDAREQQVVIKTTADRIPTLEARLRTLHPYEVPEFVLLPAAAASDAYGSWVRESVR